MSLQQFRCEQTCRNTCSALTKAMQLESEIVRLSEEMMQQCDDDNIKSFIADLAENSSEQVLTIMQKLNEVRARMQIYNNVNDMFN
ncbi:MAG: hypothetical protein HUU02_05485 [Bacteroidetes bacterium]|nr:hypothetical protein [Bacteroidota bacterium]